MEFIFLNCARARLGYPSLPCAPARITFLKNDPFLKFPKFFLQHFVHFFFVLPSSKNINSVKIFFKKKERALHLWTDTKSQVNIYKKKNIHLYYVEKRSSPYIFLSHLMDDPFLFVSHAKCLQGFWILSQLWVYGTNVKEPDNVSGAQSEQWKLNPPQTISMNLSMFYILLL